MPNKSARTIDDMIEEFRHKLFDAPPLDPRKLDHSQLRYLIERLSNQHAYQWRNTTANVEIKHILYHTIVQSGIHFGLHLEKMYFDKNGYAPSLIVEPHGFARMPESVDLKKRYYVTACSTEVLNFIGSYEDAIRLLDSLLPGSVFTLRRHGSVTQVRLEHNNRIGLWIEGSSGALALVIAILTYLELYPGEVAHWRKI